MKKEDIEYLQLLLMNYKYEPHELESKDVELIAELVEEFLKLNKEDSNEKIF